MIAQQHTRRLITLIFAGRNRMAMIRRELPRTRRAGWGRSPFRLEREKGSPFRGPWAITGAAVRKFTVVGSNEDLLRCVRHCRLLPFCVRRDGPDETQ